MKPSLLACVVTLTLAALPAFAPRVAAFADVVPPPAGAAPVGFDRAQAAAQTLAFLQQLIAIDSTNATDPSQLGGRPNGNELAVAEWFEARCTEVFGADFSQSERAIALPDGGSAPLRRRTWNVVAPGTHEPVVAFSTHVLVAAPHRANFIATLHAAAPTARPVLVMGHMDVVGADPAKWTSPPFTPTIKDGWLFGRGAIDCKGPLAAELTAFLALAARREQLARDVVLFPTAAEEGGPDLGVDFVLAHAPELLGGPEFALNEGGRVRLVDGRVQSVQVQVTEKIYYEVTARATGPSGHGSVPLPGNALAALARAVGRVHDWRAPVRLNDTTRLWLQKSALLEPDEYRAGAMRAAAASEGSGPAFDAAVAILERDPLTNALLRPAAALTILDGGFRANVIPSDGTATFNLRTLPGDDVLALVAEMERVGAEPGVTFALADEVKSAPPPSPADSALYRALESAAQAMAPEAVVLPFMSTGATDGAALRAVGIPTYGILPIPLPVEAELAMHGDNERAPVSGLGWGAELIYRTLLGVTGG